MLAVYVKPEKKIKDCEHFEQWKRTSKSLKAILDYVAGMDLAFEPESGSEAAPAWAADGSCGAVSSDNPGGAASVDVDARIEKVCEMLRTLARWTYEIPLEKRTDMRFGNLTFRKWHAKLVEEGPRLVQEILPPDKYGNAWEEVVTYLCCGFGDETRVDYGTGHELTFICALYCLECGYGYFTREERGKYVLRIFKIYMSLMRRLQSLYVLEPAGSHGVWGLDDFHHFVYIAGANQLRKQKEIAPADVLGIARDGGAKKEFENFLIGALRNVLDTKTGAPFYETSPQLSGILERVPSWDRVYSGLLKMWLGEVFDKFPVIQHFLFGTTLPYE